MSDSKLSFARSMRSQPTDAERAMWTILRAGRLGGLKFKRQVPLARYIVDFVCFEEKLIVEIDGSQHAGAVADAERDAFFASEGFRTLRFWNTEVLTNRDGVARVILVAVDRDPLSAATNSLRS
ncbi:MAG TPA: DUF559 domain-containing protein [Devosia sp.]